MANDILATLNRVAVGKESSVAFNENYNRLSIVGKRKMLAMTLKQTMGHVKLHQILDYLVQLDRDETDVAYVVHSDSYLLCVFSDDTSLGVKGALHENITYEYLPSAKRTISRLQKMSYDDIGHKVSHSKRETSTTNDIKTLDRLIARMSKYGAI